MQPDPVAAPGALTQILRAAADTEPEQGHAIDDLLQQWEPVIAATAAAAAGDAGAAAAVAPVLDELAGERDWAALPGVLRGIIGGDRGDSLLEGLDQVDTSIAGQVLARLSPPPAPPAQEQP